MVKRELLPPMRRRSIAPFFDGRYNNKIKNKITFINVILNSYGIPKYRRSNNENPEDALEFLRNQESEERSVLDEDDVRDEDIYALIKLLSQTQVLVTLVFFVK